MQKRLSAMQKIPPIAFERSVAAPRTYSDEYIEFWGGAYLANPFVHEAGVLFETFLEYPIEILLAFAQKCGTPGLIPAQRLAIARVNRTEVRPYTADELKFIAALERDGASCANGRWIEKMKHHAWPKNHGPRKYTLLEM